jgi:hypothetical protein
MTKERHTETEDALETKPKRKRQVGGRVVNEIHRVDEDAPENLEFKGSVPDIPQAAIREHIKKNFGGGFYIIQTKQGGKFKGEYEMRLEDLSLVSEPEENLTALIDDDPNESDFDESEFSFERESEETNNLKLQLLIEKEKTKRLESELQTVKAGNQSENHLLGTFLERLINKNDELTTLLFTQAQRPQQDATTQAMSILEKSLGIVTKAKAISEEIAPGDSGGGNSLLADGAKLIDSLGRNAGTFLPLIMGGGLPRTQTQPIRQQTAPTTTNGNQTNGGISNLAETFAKIKGTGTESK